MPAPSPAALMAARLMKEHHRRIAQAVVRQQQRLIPRYQQMDTTVVERNTTTILGGVQQMLEHGDERLLLSILQDVTRLRQMSGVSLSEFLVAAMCFLPVLRRFFQQRCAHLQDALEVYEAVEAIALPLMARVVRLYEEAADPSLVPLRPGGRARALTPLPYLVVEDVVGDDSLEQ